MILLIVVNCEWCGKEFNCSPSRMKAKTHCCSKECMGNLMKSKSSLNCKCDYCGKMFHRKQSAIGTLATFGY